MFEEKLKLGLVGVGLLASAAVACGSDRAQGGPAAYAEAEQPGLTEDRQSFLAERRQELEDASRQINRLESELKSDAATLPESVHREWQSRLGELRRDREQLAARVNRAEGVAAQEWREMKSQLEQAASSMEERVSRTGQELDEALAKAGEQNQRAADKASDQCPPELRGAEVGVTTVGDRVAADVTTDDAERVSALRSRVRDVAQQYQSPGAAQSPGAGIEARAEGPAAKFVPLVSAITVQDIEDGVRILLTPRRGRTDSLRQELQAEAQQMGDQRCVMWLRAETPSDQGQPAEIPAGTSQPSPSPSP